MKTRKKSRVIERLNGMRKVRKEGDWLSDVSYSLLVTQESHITRSHSDTHVLPGHKDISGTITVIGGERDLIIDNRGPFTLHLTDGRKFEFDVSGGHAASPTYRVILTSGEGLDS